MTYLLYCITSLIILIPTCSVCPLIYSNDLLLLYPPFQLLAWLVCLWYLRFKSCIHYDHSKLVDWRYNNHTCIRILEILPVVLKYCVLGRIVLHSTFYWSTAALHDKSKFNSFINENRAYHSLLSWCQGAYFKLIHIILDPQEVNERASNQNEWIRRFCW